jgi:hypothetical protein
MCSARGIAFEATSDLAENQAALGHHDTGYESHSPMEQGKIGGSRAAPVTYSSGKSARESGTCDPRLFYRGSPLDVNRCTETSWS